MDDLISRSAAINVLQQLADMETCGNVMSDVGFGLSMAIGRLISAPAADAVPVVHARWIDEIEPNAVTSSGREVHFYRCSACGFQWNKKTAVFLYFKFCPNCGARMDEKEND